MYGEKRTSSFEVLLDHIEEELRGEKEISQKKDIEKRKKQVFSSFKYFVSFCIHLTFQQ